MTAEEKILKIIEEICKYNQDKNIEVGELNAELGIVSNNIVIPRSIVLYFDYLLERRAKKVSGKVEIGGAGDEAHTHGWIDTSEYIEPLKAGDKVAYCVVSKTQVLVLGRVI